jgi:threonine/homoserine/homoserine lactone efflux protein
MPMSLLAFLSEAVFISLSGVMAPGPITAVVIGKGGESPHAGALVAIGHGLVELPLMVAIFLGIGQVLNLPIAIAAIGLAGGILLLVMSISMFRSIQQEKVASTRDGRSPMVAGILLSLANPYFFVWWATIGAALILRSVKFGVWGFLALGLSHWVCDFLWDYFLSVLSFKGGQFFGNRFQKALFAASGVLLLYYGSRLLVDTVRSMIA